MAAACATTLSPALKLPASPAGPRAHDAGEQARPLLPPQLSRAPAEYRAVVVKKLRDADLQAQKQGIVPKRFTQDEYHAEADRLLSVEYWVEQFKLADKIKPENKKGKIAWKLLVMWIYGRRSDPDRLLNRVINFLATFGLSHTALQMGSWIIHWTGASLVIPQQIKGDKGSEHFEIDAMLDLTQTGQLTLPNKAGLTEDILYRNIANVIVRWNAEAVYHNLEKNCQHFVEELLCHGMGLTPVFGDTIQRYLCAVKKDQRCIHPHYIDDKGFVVFFKSHAELDQYYLDNESEMGDNQKRLMKAFDRAFMLRWHRNEYKLTDKENVPLLQIPEGARPEVLHPEHKTRKNICKIFGPLTQA